MQDLLQALLAHGFPGVVAAIALWWAWRKDKEAIRCRNEAMIRVDEAVRTVRAVEERLAHKTETWIERYHQLSQELHRTLERLELNTRSGTRSTPQDS